MYFVSSPTALALVLLFVSLCGQVSGHPKLAQRQGAICIDTPFLQGFYDEPAVATPYCYSFLNLPTYTTTRTKTVRNSTATVTSTSIRTTITQTTTVPSTTLSSTSIVIGGDLNKRAPAPAPAIQMPAVISAAGGDPYLSASVSSACSCLFIEPTTSHTRTTVYATQSVTAVLVESITSVMTITQGTSTVVTTRTLYPGPPPLPASSTLASSTPSASTTGLNSTTSSTSSITASITTVIPSSRIPLPTFNSTVIPSTGAPFPYPTSNSTVVPSTGAPFPYPTSNSTVVPSTGTAPSVTFTRFPPFNSSSITGTRIFPTAPTNISSSISGSPTYPWNNSTSLPGTGSLTTITPPPLSSNMSATPTNTTVSPTAAPIEATGCPAKDQSFYTARDGEQFQEFCDIVYSGDQTFGVIAIDIESCMESCAIANQGFSGLRCRGVTWYPVQDTTPNCFYKSLTQVKSYIPYTGVVSALLLSQVLPGSNTTNTTITNSTSVILSPLPVASTTTPTSITNTTMASITTLTTTSTSTLTTASIMMNSTGLAIHIPTSSSIMRPLSSLLPVWHPSSSTATPLAISISTPNDIWYEPYPASTPTPTTTPVRYSTVVVTSFLTTNYVVTQVFTTEIAVTTS